MLIFIILALEVIFLFLFFLKCICEQMHVSVYLQPDRLFPKPGLFSIMFYVFLLLNQSDA